MRRALHTLFVLLLCLAMQCPLAAATIDPREAKPGADGTTAWYDGKLIGLKGKGWAETNATYSRLPAKAEKLVLPGDWGTSHNSTGIHVRFTTSSPTIRVRWNLTNPNLAMPHMPATGVSGVDLYAKSKSGQWQFVGNGRPTGLSNTAVFSGSPSHEFLLYLPLYNGVASVEIGIPKDQSIATPAEPAKPAKPIIWYGHSITQGACASRPGMASTNIVGRRLDREIVNLGFSGSGTMDAGMGVLIAELDPSIFVLDCMANMRAEDIPARVQPFIKTIRAAHPNTPIVLVDEYLFNNVPTLKGALLRKEFDKLKANGDKNLHWLSVLGMLGVDGDGTVDGVHPNDLGMWRQANAFVKSLSAILDAGNKRASE